MPIHLVLTCSHESYVPVVYKYFSKKPIVAQSIQPKEEYAFRDLASCGAGFRAKDIRRDYLNKAVQKVLKGRKYV